MRRTALLSRTLLPLLVCATSQAQDFQPRMGEPVYGLTASEMARFEAGKAEFLAILSASDGLGPIFNDSGCAQCHASPAPGGFGTQEVTRFGVAASGGNPFDPLEALGGSLLQDTALAIIPTNLWEVVPPEADHVINRATPHTFGAGLLEAVDGADIIANETNPPHPMVSGVTHMVTPLEGGATRPGRFGWKGNVSTVLHFSADASLNEMGLTNRFLTVENAPNGNQSVITTYDTVSDPEDSTTPGLGRIDRQADFQRLLAPPPQTPRSGMTGEAVFEAIGCAGCHVRDYTTGTAPEAALSNVAIKPYSDFLLHDMGSLNDGVSGGDATGEQMMTRPLWGISLRESLLHDGRATGGTFAQNVDTAIQWHDGDAAFSRTAYNALTPLEQDQLVDFLGSLGRPEFDLDHDNGIDFFDWALLEPSFTGPAPAQPILPDEDGALGDVDVDGDFDLEDFLTLQRAYTG